MTVVSVKTLEELEWTWLSQITFIFNSLYDIMLIYLKVGFWGHSYIESSQSLHQIDASGWVGLALWH